MTENENNHRDEQSKKRWEFIEKAAEEAKTWSRWKKSEFSPKEFEEQQSRTKAAAEDGVKVNFD